VVAAVRPLPGTYDVVFDTKSAAEAGRFTFRFWLDDTAPPRVRLLTSHAKPGGELRFAATDAGSGVQPATLRGSIDGKSATPFRTGKNRVAMRLRPDLAPGRHNLLLQVSDFQEDKNSETVPGILPNTRFYRATFTVS
jgi:hypothetical protein